MSALALVVVMLAGAAQAHEFLIKPVSLHAEKGTILPFSAVSAHVFMISEEMEPLEQVEAKLLLAGKSTPLKLSPNDMLLTLDGQINPQAQGTAIIAGHRKGMIWTNTTSGWKQQSKKGLQGVISSGKYEKFCKTLITVGSPDQSYKTPLGQRLEIIPQTDPSLVRPGEELVVKVLFDGKPVSVESVMATYDGFTDASNSYAYFTEPYGQGLARVKISAPGVWMVRTQHVLDKQTEDYDSHVIRSVLIFEVL
ncbi:MAG: DUF4198 domain-containing protein [Proteobacteria bacterium]|nr:DUF4198 domain-containing protein [Pseudomonadota bacterium]